MSQVSERYFLLLVWVFSALLMSLSGGSLQGQAELPAEVLAYADLVLYNGKVLTVDESFSIAEAVAARDGKVLAVGTTDRILRMAGPKTTRIDLQGNTVTPGFIDVHAGNFPGGHGPSGPSYLPNYSRVRFETLDEGLRFIKGAVEKAPPGEWVFVKSRRTTAAYQLTRQMLDPLSPNNPLLVTLDNTTGIVNSRGLAYVPEDVKAGIYKDENGEPTGRIAGWAYGVLTYEILPWPEGEAFEALVQEAKKRLEAVRALGITSYGGRRSGLSVTILRELHRRGELPVRIRTASEIARLNPHTERYLKRIGNLMDVGDEWFKIGAMTVSSIDGAGAEGTYLTRRPKRVVESWDAFGSYGQNKWRAMVEPQKEENWKEYSDYKNALVASKYGWNVTDLHIQGDAGVELFLEVIDKIEQESPVKGRRFGMVHGLMRPPDLARRLAAYETVLSFDASYLFRGDSYDNLAKLYGPDAVAGMSPIRQLIEAGLKPTHEVTNGAAFRDNPSFAPKFFDQNLFLESMELFVTRKNRDTGKVWGPEHRITREEALRMATVWAARFYGDEETMGTIERGKLADLVVLGGDYMSVPEEQISDLLVLKVIVGGKVAYEKQ